MPHAADFKRGEMGEISPDTVRRQCEQRIHKQWRWGSGCYGLRVAMREQKGRLVAFVSEEAPVQIGLGEMTHVLPYASELAAVDLDYTWGHLMRNRIEGQRDEVQRRAIEMEDAQVLGEIERAFSDMEQEAIDLAMMNVPKIGAYTSGSTRWRND